MNAIQEKQELYMRGFKDAQNEFYKILRTHNVVKEPDGFRYVFNGGVVHKYEMTISGQIEAKVMGLKPPMYYDKEKGWNE